MVDVRYRAHRILSRLASFRSLSDETEVKEMLPDFPRLMPSEEVLGVHINLVSDLSRAIVFSTEAFYFKQEREWNRITYSRISKTVLATAKRNVSGLTIVLHDNSELWLPIPSSNDPRFHDAFEVARFLDRAKVDVVRPTRTQRTGREE